IGWTALALVAPGGGAWPALGSALLFLTVAAGARAFAFPLLAAVDQVQLSLDTAIFIAATACLGVRATSIGVAVLVSTDAIARAVRQPGRAPWSGAGPSQAGAYAFYLGGLAGGLLAVLGRLVGIGTDASSDAWYVPVLGGVFLVAIYLVQAI